MARCSGCGEVFDECDSCGIAICSCTDLDDHDEGCEFFDADVDGDDEDIDEEDE